MIAYAGSLFRIDITRTAAIAHGPINYSELVGAVMQETLLESRHISGFRNLSEFASGSSESGTASASTTYHATSSFAK